MHMDYFDSFLHVELARMLDPVVHNPAPRRSRHWREGRRGRLRTLKGGVNDALRSMPPPELYPAAVPAAVPVPSSTP